jgi:plastocyanin
VGWRPSIAIIILAFTVLFSAFYFSQLTFKSIQSLQEPIHPNISQTQALENALADAKRLHPEVKDLRLFFNQYNYSATDYREHPEHYKEGYMYSVVNDVRKHPELLHLLTIYLHPNGTKFIVNPIVGTLVRYNDSSGYLSGYCLQGKYCDRSLYNAFSNRIVYGIDAGTAPSVGFTSTATWVDADTGEIVWRGTVSEQSIKRIPPHVFTRGKTVEEMLNPPGNTTVAIVYEAGNISWEKHFVPDVARGLLNINNKIIWKNEDNMVHTVTSDTGYSNPYSGKFDSGFIEGGQTYQYTFMDLGEYPYHCQIHPFMKGSVKIVANFA